MVECGCFSFEKILLFMTLDFPMGKMPRSDAEHRYLHMYMCMLAGILLPKRLPFILHAWRFGAVSATVCMLLAVVVVVVFLFAALVATKIAAHYWRIGWLLQSFAMLCAHLLQHHHYWCGAQRSLVNALLILRFACVLMFNCRHARTYTHVRVRVYSLTKMQRFQYYFVAIICCHSKLLYTLLLPLRCSC